MKKQLLMLLAALLAVSTVMSQNYDFSAVAPTGQTLYYKIINGEAHVTRQNSSYPSYDIYPAGDLIIPSRVSDGTTEYDVTSIGSSAFNNCRDLVSVTIPTSVTSIETQAFDNCISLTSINIPNSVTTIANYAFDHCSITSITIPNSIIHIGWGLFDFCSNLSYIYVEAGNTVYDCRGGCNAIIETATNTLVAGCKNTTIPNSINAIEPHAFRGHTGLTSITIPSSVTSIGGGVFNYCSGLNSITVESGNTVYDSRNNCNAIIETSTNNLIYGCSTTTIPNTVTSINENAFIDCTDLTSIDIPNSVTSIGLSAFSYCTGLTHLTIGNGTTFIGGTSFQSCINLTSVTIPNSVTYIGEWAFSYCESLTTIIIPNSVTYMGRGAFNGCHITTATIGNGISTIDNEVFYDCHELTSVTIGNNVTTIKEGAFAFCRNLTSIVCLAEVPPTILDTSSYFYPAFAQVPTDATVIVPCGSQSAYQNASNWNSFTNIQEAAGCTHTVTVSSNNDAYGTVTGSGTYAAGETVTITATPNCGYWFTHWQDSWGNTLGYSPTYTFTINSDVERTAMFEEYPLTSNINDVCSTGQTLLYDIHCPEGTATLTGYTGTCTGDLVIPDHINVGGRNYTVDSIATGAFSSNWNPEATVTSVVIPNSVTYIGAAFFNMPLTSVHIGNGVTEIESGAFDFCEHITSIVIDSANTYYDSRNNCNAIIKTSTNEIIRGCNSTTFPTTVTSIGDNAFSNCSVNFSAIPESITLIRRGAFMNCVFPSSTLIVECGGDIMEEAFFYANGFSSVSIGAAVRGIDGSAFAGCDLATITVNPANTTYDSRNNCNAVIHTTSNVLIMGCKNTIIPEEVTEIGYSAFMQQHNLTSIVIPDNVTTIHAEAFYYDGRLQSITLGRGLSLIEGYSFINCDALRSITLLSETPPTLDEYVFHTGNQSEYDFRPNCTLFVPCGKVATYQTSAGWSNFTNIQEAAGCSFTVTVSANDASYGTVSGGGIYANGETATLTANANSGCRFVRWNDNNTDNPRNIVVTSDTTLTALFVPLSGQTEEVNIRTCTGQTLRFEIDNLTHTATVIGYVGQCNGSLIVPAWFSIDDVRYTVTAIGPRAFENCRGLESVTLPRGIILVDEEAFKDCSALIEVDMK